MDSIHLNNQQRLARREDPLPHLRGWTPQHSDSVSSGKGGHDSRRLLTRGGLGSVRHIAPRRLNKARTSPAHAMTQCPLPLLWTGKEIRIISRVRDNRV